MKPEVNKISNKKDECQAELAVALPALEAAKSALDTIKPADIVIIKAMNNPPIGVKIVMAAVCVVKGIPPEKINDPNNPGQRVQFSLTKIILPKIFLNFSTKKN